MFPIVGLLMDKVDNHTISRSHREGLAPSRVGYIEEPWNYIKIYIVVFKFFLQNLRKLVAVEHLTHLNRSRMTDTVKESNDDASAHC